MQWAISLVPSCIYIYLCIYHHHHHISIVHSNRVRADPELVGGSCGWSCRLMLHPTLTCPDVGPDLCTLHPDLCTLHPDLWHKHSTWACGGFTHCNLWWWCFSIQPLAQKLYLQVWWYHPLQLALVVFFLPPTGEDTVLALEQLALCGSGPDLWWQL